jgi:tetratricopeptide (TPR) repeat protein
VENARLTAVFRARRLVLNRTVPSVAGLVKASGNSTRRETAEAVCDRIFQPDIQVAETKPSPATTRVTAQASADPDQQGLGKAVRRALANPDLLDRYIRLRRQADGVLQEIEQLKERNVKLLSALFKGRDPMEVSRDREKLRRRFQESAEELKAIGWRRKALDLLRGGEFQTPRKALAYYNKAIKAAPSIARLYLERGAVRTQLGDLAQAYQDYSRAVLLDPKLAKAYNNRGLVLERMGQRYRAIRDYDRAVEIKPGYTAAYVNRGAAYAALEQYRRALANYDTALELAPDDASIYVNRANAFTRLERFQQALQDYKRAIQLDPNLAKAYDNRGVLFHRLEEYEKMCRDFENACELGLCNNYKAARARGLCP